MKYYDDDFYEEKQPQQPAWQAHIQDFGCGFCYDSRKKKDIELFFIDKANNMRVCEFCPSCGRPYNK